MSFDPNGLPRFRRGSLRVKYYMTQR
ncbi:hypothetical protein CCACVL1_23749, partial [Corchorus capsularis]